MSSAKPTIDYARGVRHCFRKLNFSGVCVAHRRGSKLLINSPYSSRCKSIRVCVALWRADALKRHTQFILLFIFVRSLSLSPYACPINLTLCACLCVLMICLLLLENISGANVRSCDLWRVARCLFLPGPMKVCTNCVWETIIVQCIIQQSILPSIEATLHIIICLFDIVCFWDKSKLITFKIWL